MRQPATARSTRTPGRAALRRAPQPGGRLIDSSPTAAVAWCTICQTPFPSVVAPLARPRATGAAAARNANRTPVPSGQFGGDIERLATAWAIERGLLPERRHLNETAFAAATAGLVAACVTLARPHTVVGATADEAGILT